MTITHNGLALSDIAVFDAGANIPFSCIMCTHSGTRVVRLGLWTWLCH